MPSLGVAPFPKAGSPSWGRCWCVSPCPCLPPQASFHLPRSPEPGIHWNPRAPRSPAVRHPAAAPDTGWVAGRSSNSGRAAGSSLEASKEPGAGMSGRKVPGCGRARRGALWGDGPRPGPSSTPGGGLGAAGWRDLPGSPACDPLPQPPGRCYSRRGACGFGARAPGQPSSGPCGGPAARGARRGGKDTGLRPVALPRWPGRPLRGGLPPLRLAKSLKARAPFVTPGAPNHPVSISLTLFIPLKTHLKTLGVCSGLYPH